MLVTLFLPFGLQLLLTGLTRGRGLHSEDSIRARLAPSLHLLVMLVPRKVSLLRVGWWWVVGEGWWVVDG